MQHISTRPSCAKRNLFVHRRIKLLNAIDDEKNERILSWMKSTSVTLTCMSLRPCLVEHVMQCSSDSVWVVSRHAHLSRDGMMVRMLFICWQRTDLAMRSTAAKSSDVPTLASSMVKLQQLHHNAQGTRFRSWLDMNVSEWVLHKCDWWTEF